MIVVYVIWNKKSQLLRRTLPIAYTDPGDGHTMQVSLTNGKMGSCNLSRIDEFLLRGWGGGVEVWL